MVKWDLQNVNDHLVFSKLRSFSQAFPQKKRDKLLVETNIFAILGVSFCATQT